MARQFMLCLVVTLLMVFAVISVSCEQTNQDGQKIQNRGTARYHFKLTSESTDFTALTTKSPRNKSSRAETAFNLEKHETHFMKENSFRSRSRMADGAAVTTRINAKYLNSNVNNLQNRSKLHTSQVFKKEIMNSRHGDNKENTPESQRLKQQTASPRISLSASSVWIDSAKLDHEVFTKSPDYSRSRTGRKIYTNYNGKELKSQIIPSRKLANENIEKEKNPIDKLEEKEVQLKNPRVENIALIANISKVINTKNMNDSNKRKEESIKERDVLPLDFESVLRVNIPLTIKNDENANLLTSATISSVKMSLRPASRLIKEKVESNDIVGSNTKKSKQSDRSKSRRTSNANNLETVNSESISRRSSPRSAEIANMGINGRSSSARRRSNAKNVNSRNRSAHKLRDMNTTETRNNDRKKDVDTNFETNVNEQTKTRRKLSNNERTSEGKRRSRNNRKLKVTETKINQDKQNARAQSGNWSRTVSNLDITTSIPKATIAEATTISSLNIKIATVSSLSTTIKSSTPARVFSSTEQTSRNKEKNRKEDSQIKKPMKEDFFNHGLGFRGRKISIEESSTAIADLRTTTFKSETQLHGNPGWTLRRRPNYINHDTPSTTSASVNQNQTNEIILSNDLSKSTETPLSNAKVLRRGTKRPKAKDENNTLSSVAPKNVTRGRKTFNKSENFGLPKSIELEESDNYPLAFRDRLSQLKNSNLKFTGEKSTTRTSLQATKSSTENLFSEKSKLKLDLARRLIKPELNVDENNFDEMIFVSHSDKSQVKEILPVNKDRNVEKTTKATSKFNGVHVSHESSIIANTQKEKSITRDRWKILEDRQSLKDRNIKGSFRSSMIKKNQIPTEKAIISSSLEGTSLSSITKFNIIPRRITISRRGTISVKETAATTIDTKVRSSMLQSTLVPREETSTLANTMETLDKNNIVTTIEPLKLDETSIEIIKSDKQERSNNDIQKETAVALGTTSIMDTLIESRNIYTTEFAHEITLSPTVTTPSSMHSSTTESKKLYPVYIPDAKKYDLSENKSMKFVNDARKSIFQPRYTKQQEPDKVAVSMVTSMTVGPTSRYIKKKSGVFTPYDAVPKPLNTEATFTQTKHREFRPRTATYRRHSEVPTSQLMIQQSSKADKEAIADFVTITSKPTKYNTHVTARSHSNSSKPLVNVKIDTLNDNLPLVFIESSNSNSSDSNIFNPTKSAIFSKNVTTLLEQLRSTVAPLLNSLSEKTPIFSGAYSNVNIGNSAPRITPNGSAPRFSARYKGAELFVRKPSIEQVVIPSITTSSTTTSTLIENSDLAPPVHINSSGEPRFITFYQALESASIRNENLSVNDVSQRQKLTGGITKVDSNATVPNGINNDTANNNDIASPKSATIAATSFPDISTIDITTAVQSANLSFASRLATEIISDNNSKIISTIIPISANSDTNGQTTAPIMKLSKISASDNTMTNTLASANISNTLMLLNVTTNEIVTIDTSTNVDVISDTLPSMKFTSENIRPFESVNISAETMKLMTSSTIKPVTDVFTPASMNLQISTNISDTTSPITESVIVTQISSEATTISVMNNISENIETNTVQQYDKTTPQTTKIKDVTENIEMNMIQQFDATVPPQMTESTSTIESITTEEISNDIIEIQDSTVRTSIEKPTTTTISSKLFNTILDSFINTKNLEETTTLRETNSRNVGIIPIQDVDIELITTQTTTKRPGQKNIVDLVTAFSIAHNRSNDQKISALNMPNSNTTQNAKDSSIDAEIMTSSRLADFITKNDSRSSNDTLLTKLMTIAKTLFSEEINETRQSLFMSDQINDFKITIIPDINNLTQADGMIKNDDKNQLMLSNNMSKKINASTELSTVLEKTLERINIITSRNETEERSNRGPIVGTEILLMELNTQPTDITNSIDDTMTTTIAQGTEIGSRIIQSEQPTETTITSIFTTSSEFPTVDTTILSSSIEPITDTATMTSTITTTTLQTTSTKPSQADLATTASFIPEATTPVININENLISTETTIIDTQNTMVASIESEELTTTTTITSPMSMPTATTISPTTQSITSEQVISHPPSLDIINMGSYLRSFGGNQATTPASRFSSSSKTPIRDYQVYGIYPNKTIVRKRPEDNLIDARNINSPYVIFGIFPDGRLVRKFPNGTIISDSPRNPVEVVFTLSTTTTTNRPASRPYYNQVNQAGTYNQYKSPLYYSNSMYYSKPVDKLTGDIQNLSPVDFGFTDNAISVPSGVGPKFATSFGPPASTPCANKMSDILLNTRMNTLPNVASMYGKLQGPIGSSIIKDHESSEASRIKVTSNQRSSVYIGQDKFINYQIDNAPDINSKVVDVKINSVATSMNEGVASSMTSIPSFENLLSNQSGGGIVTTPSGFPWKDPLDQIFGIATNSSIQIASVASNQLNETTGNNGPIMARPINPLVEVFTPIISGVTPTNFNNESKPTTLSISSITTTTPITTTIPITTTTPIITTIPIPTTIATTTAATTTTTTATTTSTTTTAATTTTTISTTTTPTTTTINQTTSSTSAPRRITTTSSINISSDITTHSNIVSPTATISADNILNKLQMNTKENVFGTTFEDLTFLNSLLQNNNVKTTSKTLNDIEQMLANRILALAKPGLTRSPKSIKTVSSNSVLNAIKDFPSSESSSEPIIIDLLPSLSTPSPSISASTTKKYTEAETSMLVQPNTVPLTTKAPVVITAKSKTTIQPKTTTQAPVGFGVNLWRALFGSNRFEASTIASTKKNPKSVTPRSVQATQKSIAITPKPVQIIKSTTPTSHIMSAIRSHSTPRTVDISDIQVISTKLHADNVDSVSASTLSPISTQRTLLNNPNPRLNDVSTSTYSSKDDAKFLAALLRSIQTGSKTSTSTTTSKIIEDDEAFLRAILNNQANISTVIPSSTELNPAALLALLLKQQGIEPSTPAIKFKEQLQLANLDLTTSRSMTTTTNRPAFSSSTQSAVSMRRTTTPRRSTPRQSSKSSERIPWSPSSTYPPPLFGENSGSGLITATRAIGQFLGAAITGAAQQLQSFLRNGTRSIPG
ncbi:uncharacterized protein LOC126852966 [Cataglyphis hispanica]|uniref:uncharacterized protein LOC126852966 n=1 Tax=Cataglyphis hispanica TaxID=1086592 RepID=UPI00217F9FE3|nr:uncharacterized protein LOC126852966 [Cataglyphis hispanica]